MPKDVYQRAVERKEIDIWIVGEIRREAVVQYLASKGYKILAEDDPQTKRLLDIPANAPAADIVAEVSPRRLVLAEVKGKDIQHAITQLAATAAAVRKKFSDKYQGVECKIFCKYPTPPKSEFGMPGSLLGFRALRVFGSSYPSEWLLYEHKSESSSELVNIGGSPVMIVFGPYDGPNP